MTREDNHDYLGLFNMRIVETETSLIVNAIKELSDKHNYFESLRQLAATYGNQATNFNNTLGSVVSKDYIETIQISHVANSYNHVAAILYSLVYYDERLKELLIENNDSKTSYDLKLEHHKQEQENIQQTINASKSNPKSIHQLIMPHIMEKKQIFISYSSKDWIAATYLYLYLKSEGYSPWISYFHHVGTTGYEEIFKEEIEKSSLVIYGLSENSINSDWVGYEQTHSIGKRLLISLDNKKADAYKVLIASAIEQKRKDIKELNSKIDEGELNNKPISEQKLLVARKKSSSKLLEIINDVLQGGNIGVLPFFLEGEQNEILKTQLTTIKKEIDRLLKL